MKQVSLNRRFNIKKTHKQCFWISAQEGQLMVFRHDGLYRHGC